MTSVIEFGENLANTHVRNVCGVRAILAHKQLLEGLAAASGQPTFMHCLQFSLEHEYVRRKTPHLICIVAGKDPSAPLTLDSLLGCVLLFEYRFALWDTGLFATGDNTGVCTAVAPHNIRAQVASIAASEALRVGRMVLVCYRNETGEFAPIAFREKQQGLWAAQVRGVKDHLRLSSTYDGTLETFGKRTRTHLRYYRKRLVSETGCVFVPNAADYIPDSQLSSLNSASLDPANQQSFDQRFHAASQHPDGYVCGLRAADGRWLCLAGGWRQNQTTLLHWQINADGFPKISLTTAFRAFLIEHEVSLGTKELRFLGGTPHSVAHAFRQEFVVDLLVRKCGLIPSLIMRFVLHFAERGSGLGTRGNFLIDALLGRNLTWIPMSSVAVPAEVGGSDPA